MPRPSNGQGGMAFALGSGGVCRSWDDFLAISSQKWGELRDELASGRLASYLSLIGQGNFAPVDDPTSSPDERLDAWLARLPTTRANRPELDVQPGRIAVEIRPEGPPTRLLLRVGNVGDRLLRFRLRVEPADAAWVVIPPEYLDRESVSPEGEAIPLEIRAPSRGRPSRPAAIVITSNGGDRRIPVTIGGSGDARLATPPLVEPFVGLGLGVLARVLLVVGAWASGGSIAEPPGFLPTLALVGAIAAAVGLAWPATGTGIVDRIARGIVGLVAGTGVGNLAYHLSLVIEPNLPAPPWLGLIVWGLTGLFAGSIARACRPIGRA